MKRLALQMCAVMGMLFFLSLTQLVFGQESQSQSQAPWPADWPLELRPSTENTELQVQKALEAGLRRIQNGKELRSILWEQAQAKKSGKLIEAHAFVQLNRGKYYDRRLRVRAMPSNYLLVPAAAYATELACECGRPGHPLTVTTGLRFMNVQQYMWEHRFRVRKFTNAIEPGRSSHPFGTTFDLRWRHLFSQQQSCIDSKLIRDIKAGRILAIHEASRSAGQGYHIMVLPSAPIHVLGQPIDIKR